MRAILGIDAAWTTNEPSGVALLVERNGNWCCVAVAPSYEAFYSQAEGQGTNWTTRNFRGSAPDVRRLLAAAEALAGAPVHVVAVDIPVANTPITSRRIADNSVSAEFGARWCSAHTPNEKRPGEIGKQLSHDFKNAGFRLDTTLPRQELPVLIEVYPHPALLSLLQRDRRVPYKVSKSGKYWPGLERSTRILKLLEEFRAIELAIRNFCGPIPIVLPNPQDVHALAGLKRYEDALDALVCAWVGVKHLQGQTVPLGDSSASIWCPADIVSMPSHM